MPGSRHYFRATAANGRSAQGTFVTATPPGRRSGLRFGVSGDWRGELAPYPAVANAKGRGLDFFVLLGDTIYADYPSTGVAPPAGGGPWRTTALKHAEVYGERFGLNTLADLRAGDLRFSPRSTITRSRTTSPAAPRSEATTASAATRRLSSTTASSLDNGLCGPSREYNPVRRPLLTTRRTTPSPTTSGGSVPIPAGGGDDAAVLVLDTRSFRDPGLGSGQPVRPG